MHASRDGQNNLVRLGTCVSALDNLVIVVNVEARPTHLIEAFIRSTTCGEFNFSVLAVLRARDDNNQQNGGVSRVCA